MDINSKRIPSTNSNNAELEKFSRRLIRAVSRMLLLEKRDEEEVWEGLKKETGFDCKELWFRMRALTIRKLDRLLEVEDQVDSLPKAARMSLTNWLLFDTVLVHQNFDVIGMTETSTEDRQVLVDLFDLVEKYKLEFLAGEQLADAWSAATIEYNKNNRQCTPMLLQRRWYQLRLATRNRFYEFWYNFKGVAKKMDQAEPYKPTPLQTRIAKTYKHLVVTAFSPWEELIKNRLVILREEFAARGMQKEDVLDEDSPDVICIEKNVETIDLEDDSDVELEYRKSQQKENKDSTAIKIKQEPKDTYESDIDESVPYQNRQDKISYFAEAVMKATTLELEEIDLADNMGPAIATIEDKDDAIVTDDDLSDREVAVTSSQAKSRIPSLIEENNINSAIENPSNIVSDNIIGTENTDHDVNDVMETVHLKFESDVEIIQDKQSEQLLPQITNIFGGVNDSAEALSKISMFAAQITDSENQTIIVKAPDPNESAIELSRDSIDKVIGDVTENEIVDVPSKPSQSEDNSSVIHNLQTETDIKSETNKSLWFGDLSNDMDFVDDGIQWIDDGIAYEDDMSETDWIKTETDVNAEENREVKTEDEETNHNKFDEKLLMVPVVLTVKLDDMGLLPIHLLNHVNNKCLIDIISCKSKLPIRKIDDTKSECNEDDVTDNVKKVKLSSYLLQKPRNRKYNPIQLCKNPDFNTRLKRLNVGFFSSTRNRLLFKSCQPVTIDVSKAFEDRLVDGTIYLEICDDDNTQKNNDIPDSAENNSVLPSAMPAQSLIDNTRGEIVPIKYNDMNINVPLEVPPQACQRNKTINLPDITEIRRINQNLLTAEVTPIQIKNYDTEIERTQTITNDLVNNVPKFKVVAGPASRKRPTHIREQNKIRNSISNMLTDTDLQTAQNNPLRQKKCYNRFVRWKPRELRPEVTWVGNHNVHYTSDTLLALDTLNKMLCLLTEGDKALAKFEGKKKKKKKASEDQDKTGHQLKPSPNDKNLVKNDDTDEVQVISETFDTSEASNKIQNPVYRSNNKKQRHVICCWARERISRLQYPRKRKRKHTCPFPLCLCCCKFDLLNYYKKAREENTDTDIQKPPIWMNSLDNEANYDGKQENVAVEKDADVAELIPIQNTNKIDLQSNLNVNNSSAEVILCSDKTTLSTPVADISASDKPLPSEISSQDEEENYIDTSLTLGAEVSIITSESTSFTDTNDKINNSSSLKNPRIRVKHSVGKISKHVNRGGGPTRFMDIAINTDVSSTAEVEDSIITSKDDSSEINVLNSTHPKTTSSNHAETTPTSINNLYLCIEPLVSQASEFVTDKREVVPSRRSGRLLRKISDATIEVAPKKNKRNIITDLPNNNNAKENSFQFRPLKPMNTVVVTPQMAHKGSNKKMIYLNSKQIAELPSDNPIHLGKNKILLTTFEFPSNFKAFESYQRNLKKTMALPKGILLILLPNGRLTYKVNIKAKVSNEFLAAMPHLIDAIQQQIDSEYPLPTDNMSSVNSLPNNEVICLSDEESSDVKTSETSIKYSQKQQVFNGLNNINNSDTPHVENSNSQTETNVVSSKENMTAVDIENLNENVDLEHIITRSTEALSVNTNSGEINCTLNNSTLPEKNRDLSETSKESIEEKVSENISNEKSTGEHNPSEINSEHLETPNANITNEEINENKCVERNNSKTKNILSDLMAMSGILPTEYSQESSSDVIPQKDLPVPNLVPVSQLQGPSQLILPQHYAQPPTQFTPNPSQSTENSKAGLRTLFTVDTETYTPITSLSELKYACTNNATFFKLDLDTKLLVPINVCMKSVVGKGSANPIKSNANKVILNGPTIDLTDDDDTRHKEKVNMNHDSEDTNNTLSDNTTKQAKPLILVHARNLQNKFKRIRKVVDLKRNTGTPVQRKRKQELTEPLNSLCDKLTEQASTMTSAESSSDEEPLANLAIKKRRNENEKPDNISDSIDLHTDDVNSVSDNIGDTVVESLEESDIDNAEDATDFAGPHMGTPEVVMEYLDEELLQEDESWILGV